MFSGDKVFFSLLNISCNKSCENNIISKYIYNMTGSKTLVSSTESGIKICFGNKNICVTRKESEEILAKILGLCGRVTSIKLKARLFFFNIRATLHLKTSLGHLIYQILENEKIRHFRCALANEKTVIINISVLENENQLKIKNSFCKKIRRSEMYSNYFIPKNSIIISNLTPNKNPILNHSCSAPDFHIYCKTFYDKRIMLVKKGICLDSIHFFIY
jgi:hypothetical protein